MKQELFEELAERWKREGEDPDCMDGAPDAEVHNARTLGYHAALRRCAEDVTKLIALLGE